MQNVDHVLIRAYLAVAKTGSVRSASKIVGRTAAAVSNQIARLEAALGQKLFMRNGRGMVLSVSGQKFLIHANSFIKLHDQFLNKDTSFSSEPDNVSAPKTVAQFSERLPVSHTNGFEKNLETHLFKSAFSIWQSCKADGRMLSLEDLTKRGLLCFVKDNIILADFEQAEFRIVGASKKPTRLFQLDKHGFGIKFDQIWKTPKICDSRQKIFLICHSVTAPVFFSGNAPIPWHSDFYLSTIDQFAVTKLDRLLLPVKIRSQSDDRLGILQIAEFRGHIKSPIKRNMRLSEEEQAAGINLISNISVAI